MEIQPSLSSSSSVLSLTSHVIIALIILANDYHDDDDNDEIFTRLGSLVCKVPVYRAGGLGSIPGWTNRLGVLN